MRIDKYLANLGIVPRRQIKKLLKQGEVLLNNQEVKKADTKITEGDILLIYGQEIEVQLFVTVMLHKPQGYISSDVDEGDYHSYKDLLYDCPYSELLHVAGRLDADTEGLLLCTSDGKLTHSIVHPKNHVEKEYFVRTALPMNKRMKTMLESGVLLDGEVQAKPAKVELLNNHELRLIITEGKYHQVKRMLMAAGNEVVYLRRDRIGNLCLGDLAIGERKYVLPSFDIS